MVRLLNLLLLDLLQLLLGFIFFVIILNALSLNIFESIVSLKITIIASIITISLVLTISNVEIIRAVFVFLIIGVIVELFNLIAQITIGG